MRFGCPPYEFGTTEGTLEATGPHAKHARSDGLHAEAFAQFVDVDRPLLVYCALQYPEVVKNYSFRLDFQ